MSSSREPSPSASGVLKPSEVLAKAADLIEPEGAWTQGVFARNARSAAVNFDDPHAACWCARGAISKVMGKPPNGHVAIAVVRRATLSLYGRRDEGELARFNDSAGQAEVVAALRKASALAAEAGQ